jgi:hypothetical protein
VNISLSRLLYDREQKKVAYSYTSAYDHQDKIERLDPRELIARLATHIPNRYERAIRYYGVYSSRAQGVRRARTTPDETGSSEEKSLPTHWRSQWQQLLQHVFHVTLSRPTCGTKMKILSFISASEPVHKILDHLKSKKIDPRAGPFANKAA